MEQLSYKRISNILYLLGFVCAALMLGNRTFGYRSTIHVIFYIAGAGALVFSLLSARFEEKGDFNVLSWIGTLLIFLAFLLKTATSYWMYVLIGGLAVTGFSYFFNPSKKEEDEEDQLLDR
jgi:hypothetical protein